MKNFYISEMLLLSQKEHKAKRIKFDSKRTVILGKNDTGKSSLIKSIYRTFGAETQLHPGFKNANVASMIKFTIDGIHYAIVRDDKIFALFDFQGKLIKKFASVTNELGPFLSDLFSFKPLLQNRSNRFLVPPPAYLFLPYYIDQDKGWMESWKSFKNLQQFKKHRENLIYYHTGIRPNEYYHTKSEITENLNQIAELESERKLTENILKQMREKLSQTEFNIDIDAFKEEVKQLLIECELLKKKEDILKNKLLDFYDVKITLESQIEIVKHALTETAKDYQFASLNLHEQIACPTCGASYDNSFAERFDIAKDEQRCKDLLLELNKELLDISEKIDKENSLLNKTSEEVTRIEQILLQKKENVILKDVLDNYGKNQLKGIFSERIADLNKSIYDNEISRKDLNKKLKTFENKERTDTIKKDYRTTLSRYLKQLEVFSLTEEDYNNITTPIENKETGSSRPRALMAYYFTFFDLMQKYSSSAYCPLIIDSPNQQAQDIEHIDRILEFIKKNQPEKSQMILGLEELYKVEFNCDIIELKEKYSLLQKQDYEEVFEIMNSPLSQIWFA